MFHSGPFVVENARERVQQGQGLDVRETGFGRFLVVGAQEARWES